MRQLLAATLRLPLRLRRRNPALSKAIPSWVTKDGSGGPAVLFLDIENNRGWYSGKRYRTEADTLAALNGVANLKARRIGGYVDPTSPELLVNGDFSAGIGGWTSLASAIAAVVDGKLEMSGTGLTNPTVRSVAIPVQQGGFYAVRATYYKGTAVNSPSIVTSRSATMSPLSNGMPANTTTTPVTNERTFGGEGASHYVGIRTVSGPSGTVIGDDFSVKKASAFKEAKTSEFAAIIKFRTPAALPAAGKVLFAFDDNGARNVYKAQIEANGNMTVILDSNGANRYTYTIPAALVTLDAVHTLHLSSDGLGGTRFFAAFDDVNLYGQQGGFTPPGVGWLRVGESATAGSEWTGDILSMAFFAKENVPPRFIWAVGDSYVAGTGGASVEQGIEASNPARLCISTGLGGSSIPTQLTAMQAAPGLHGCVLVHWDGDANAANALTDPVVIEAMAALARRHVFVGSGRRMNHAAGELIATDARNTYLSGRFGTRYVDPMPTLIGLSTGSVEDLAAVAAGCIPPSALQADGTHLTPAAMAAVGAVILAKVAALGW